MLWIWYHFFKLTCFTKLVIITFIDLTFKIRENENIAKVKDMLVIFYLLICSVEIANKILVPKQLENIIQGRANPVLSTLTWVTLLFSSIFYSKFS